MSVLDRILLVVLALLGLCCAIMAFFLGVHSLSDSTMAVWLLSRKVDATVIVLSIVFAVISIRFLFYRLGGSPVDYIALSGDHGHIRISFDTFRQLAIRSGKSVRGVEDFEARVAQGQSGVVVAVRVRVLPDVDIARVSADVQQAVKTGIEQATGVTVERIPVNVVELAQRGSKGPRAWVD